MGQLPSGSLTQTTEEMENIASKCRLNSPVAMAVDIPLGEDANAAFGQLALAIKRQGH